MVKKIFLFYTILHVFPLVSLSIYNSSSETDKWPYTEHTYVKAYLYNLENDLKANHAIIQDGKLNPSVVGEGISLNNNQIKAIIDVTNEDIGGLVLGLSKTYIPHHGFVFYNSDDKPVAYITMSFDGEAIRVFPEIERGGSRSGRPVKQDRARAGESRPGRFFEPPLPVGRPHPAVDDRGGRKSR